jgi:hypothetical protein
MHKIGHGLWTTEELLVSAATRPVRRYANGSTIRQRLDVTRTTIRQ